MGGATGTCSDNHPQGYVPPYPPTKNHIWHVAIPSFIFRSGRTNHIKNGLNHLSNACRNARTIYYPIDASDVQDYEIEDKEH